MGLILLPPSLAAEDHGNSDDERASNARCHRNPDDCCGAYSLFLFIFFRHRRGGCGRICG